MVKDRVIKTCEDGFKLDEDFKEEKRKAILKGRNKVEEDKEEDIVKTNEEIENDKNKEKYCTRCGKIINKNLLFFEGEPYHSDCLDDELGDIQREIDLDGYLEERALKGVKEVREFNFFDKGNEE